jgi:hypothetical protein
VGQICWKLVCKFVLMISRSSSYMGHLESKTMSHCPNIEKLVIILVVTILTQLSSNLVRMLAYEFDWSDEQSRAILSVFQLVIFRLTVAVHFFTSIILLSCLFLVTKETCQKPKIILVSICTRNFRNSPNVTTFNELLPYCVLMVYSSSFLHHVK